MGDGDAVLAEVDLASATAAFHAETAVVDTPSAHGQEADLQALLGGLGKAILGARAANMETVLMRKWILHLLAHRCFLACQMPLAVQSHLQEPRQQFPCLKMHGISLDLASRRL